MDQQTIVTLVVSAIVTVLTLLYRYWKPADPLKSWVEMLAAIAGAIVIAGLLGQIGKLPDPSDPIAVIQFFLEKAAIVFAFVQLVYNLLKQAFPTNTVVARALMK